MGGAPWLSRAFVLPTLRGYRRFVELAWRASPALTVLTAASTLVAAVAPLAGLALAGVVVAQIPAVISSGLGSAAGWTALMAGVAVGLLFAVQRGSAALQSAAATALGQRVDLGLQNHLMSAVMAPAGIAHLEDARTLDLITVGRDSFRGWIKPGRLALNLSQLAAARFTLIGACLILVRFQWAVALLILAAVLWTEYEAREASSRGAQHHYGGSMLARRTDYYYELGVQPGAAKEVRVFGLPGFLLERFGDTWKQAIALVFDHGHPRALVSTGALAAVLLGAFAWLGFDAVGGHLGLGLTMVTAQAILVSLGSLGALTTVRLQSEVALAALRKYDQAVDAVPAADPAPGGKRLPSRRRPEREIRFDGVSFRYPGQDRDVLGGLDLTIPAGRSLAIVGANGAGKTTLIKLLCRLYQPTAGRILVDGDDLSNLETAAWQRRIAAVFQDHVGYELNARTNVGFGWVEAQGDLEGIQAAAERAGASDAVSALPRGWETVLSPQYHDGADLSGGQWQKLALARALFAVRHGAGVLILDEPAANLDARAEAELYEAFLGMTRGVTTVVISHRFSTVRQAASIAVLRDGRVVELGTHYELMELDGHYAEMFRLQAARFVEAPSE